MILIVDFGSQTAHLIGRRLRQLGIQTVYAYPHEAFDAIEQHKPTGIILSGSPDFVDAEKAPKIDDRIFSLGIPILGICYGWQLMSYLLGGEGKITNKEYGPETVTLHKAISICKNLPSKFTGIVSHGYTVTKLPPGFECIGSTEQVDFTIAVNDEQRLYGVQFHPEAQHTEYGIDILKNFAYDICHEVQIPVAIDPEAMIADIKHRVGNHQVIMAVSGGVDSTVAAFLIGKAIGNNLIPVYVDSGLMRPYTKDRVETIFTKLITANLVIVPARERFLKTLHGITDPEIKRKTIGKLYIDIFEEIAQQFPDAKFLGQGTIYSDVIESQGTKHASRIKSHHNVGGLPENMNFELIEPLRSFYKDEVRELGRKLGIPDEILNEHPFPGPGYAVYIRGEVNEKRLSQVIQVDMILVDELKRAGLYEKAFQCFPVMTGAYSTAVKGDERAFAEVVAIRIFETDDIMTGRWMDVPYQTLDKISRRIVNEVPDISRVVYDISNKPPSTITWE
ncbi:MAG: glutamine-hydrolyzing GMP synthase [Patescibacteria group bacterium]|nr:glutamine-hydrolyzing GMP synthase [Patescibacteria group bacterium]